MEAAEAHSTAGNGVYTDKSGEGILQAQAGYSEFTKGKSFTSAAESHTHTHTHLWFPGLLSISKCPRILHRVHWLAPSDLEMYAHTHTPHLVFHHLPVQTLYLPIALPLPLHRPWLVSSCCCQESYLRKQMKTGQINTRGRDSKNIQAPS